MNLSIVSTIIGLAWMCREFKLVCEPEHNK